MLPITVFALFIAPYARSHFGRTERGASLVEYLLLVMLIAIVCIGSITWFGGSNSDGVNEVGSQIA